MLNKTKEIIRLKRLGFSFNDAVTKNITKACLFEKSIVVSSFFAILFSVVNEQVEKQKEFIETKEKALQQYKKEAHAKASKLLLIQNELNNLELFIIACLNSETVYVNKRTQECSIKDPKEYRG